MEWGIIVAGFTMFGVLVLVLAHVLTEESPESVTSSASYHEEEPASDELRKAA